MKKILLLLIVAIAISCSEDDSKEEYRSITLTERIQSDSHPVDKTESYSFLNNRVTNLNVKQVYVESETTFSTQLVYEGNTIIRTDIFGNQATYILNSSGYVTQCQYKESDITRDYTFSYSANNYLERVDESINGNPHSTLIISYKDGDITSVALDGAPIIYETGTDENKYALPCLPLLESYPISYHKEAYFSGLLGKPNRHFVTRTAYEGNTEESTDYTYQFSTEGKPTSISTRTKYIGEVWGKDGIPYPIPSIIQRKINISME